MTISILVIQGALLLLGATLLSGILSVWLMKNVAKSDYPDHSRLREEVGEIKEQGNG